MTTRNHEPENLQLQSESCALVCRMCERLGSDLQERAQLGDEARKVRDIVSDAVAFRATLAGLHSGVRRLIDALAPGDIEVSLPWFWCAGPLIPGPVGPLLVGRLASWLDSDPPLERLLELKVHLSRGYDPALRSGDAWGVIDQACAEALKRAAFATIGDAPPHSSRPSPKGKGVGQKRHDEMLKLENLVKQQLSGTGTGTHTLSINVAIAEELSHWFGNAVQRAISMVRAKAVGPDEQRHLEAVSRSSATVIEWTLQLDDLLRRVAERILKCPDITSEWVRDYSAFHGHEAGSQLQDRLWEWMHSDGRTSEELEEVRGAIFDLYRDAPNERDRYWAAWTLMTIRTGTFQFRATEFFSLRERDKKLLPDDCQEEVDEANALGAIGGLLRRSPALLDDFGETAGIVCETLGVSDFLDRLFGESNVDGGEWLVEPLLDWVEEVEGVSELIEAAKRHEGKALPDELLRTCIQRAAVRAREDDGDECDDGDDCARNSAAPAASATPPFKAVRPKTPASAPPSSTSVAAPTRPKRRRE